MNDENFWPGPTWDFTIHEVGFPPNPVDGDLYRNQSGLMYLCHHGLYHQLTIAEWNELLDISPVEEELEPKTGEFEVSPGNIITLSAGESVVVTEKNKPSRVYLCMETPSGILVLIPSGFSGKIIRDSRVR